MRLARAAGVAVEAIRGSGFITTAKLDHSPVTEADLAADRIITEGLRAARPGVRILSEESQWSASERDDFDSALTDDDDELWCIDPIDGTEAFIDRRTRGYAVQIAKLVRVGSGHAGHWKPVLGVVFEPNHDELFAAVSGEPLVFERAGVAVTDNERVGAIGPGRIVTSTRAPEGLRQALFARGFGDAGKLRSVGIKVAALVKGQAEIYPAAPALAYWDLAAPQVVLEAAGGTVTDIEGQAPAYRFGSAANPTDELTFALPLLLTRGVDHAAVLVELQAAAELNRGR